MNAKQKKKTFSDSFKEKEASWSSTNNSVLNASLITIDTKQANRPDRSE